MHRDSEWPRTGPRTGCLTPAALTPPRALWVGLGCPGGTRQAGKAASSRLRSKACIGHRPDTLSPLGSMLVKGSFKEVTFYSPVARHRTVTHKTVIQDRTRRGSKVTAVHAGHAHPSSQGNPRNGTSFGQKPALVCRLPLLNQTLRNDTIALDCASQTSSLRGRCLQGQWG